MVRFFVVRAVCLRCGNIDEFNLGLTNKDTNANYKCSLCNFILFTSWMEDDSDQDDDSKRDEVTKD